ncbi:hypothetical protein [Hyphomicrobium sulfonivorans]|uniref:hypothetical protein n=1 Tax=Hyphomicrobium sulfonivorans TaxID=121290 RepID=UPI000838ADE8|nr:hypothetical protein [Hyphomicrobium sulfonivorans]
MAVSSLQHHVARMLKPGGWLLALICFAVLGAAAAKAVSSPGTLLAPRQIASAQTPLFTLAKLGIGDMSSKEQANLWKLVDEYATVDALQEFCGIKLNLQRRALNAVGSCVEAASLKKVFSTFRSKKGEYLKQWQTLHGEEEAKKTICDRFKTKLTEYSKIMSGQINEAATACRNCFFC